MAVLNPLLRERITFFSERNINVHNPFKLADLAATLSAGSPDKLQAVLSEKSAEGRLRLALDIISKVMVTVTVAKAVTITINTTVIVTVLVTISLTVMLARQEIKVGYWRRRLG